MKWLIGGIVGGALGWFFYEYYPDPPNIPYIPDVIAYPIIGFVVGAAILGLSESG